MHTLKLRVPTEALKILRDIANDQPAEEEWTIPAVAEALLKIGGVTYFLVERSAKRNKRTSSLSGLMQAVERSVHEEVEVIFVEVFGRD